MIKKLIVLSFCLSALATLRAEFVVQAGAGATYITPMDVVEVNRANGAAFPATSIKMKPGPMFFISPGFEVGSWELSLEFNASNSNVKSLGLGGNSSLLVGRGSLYVFTAMPSLQYKLVQGSGLSWNISAGAGASRVNSEHIGVIGGSDWSTAWDTTLALKLGTSVEYDLSSRIALSVGANYLRSDDPRLATNSHTRLDIKAVEQTQLYLSVAYKF